jgi:hypothetical protein
MLPMGLTAKALQLCAAGFGGAVSPTPAVFAITIHTGATLRQAPANLADAEATVRVLIVLGADFTAGPLEIAGRDFATYGVTPASVFDACALAHIDDGQSRACPLGTPSVSKVAALVRRAFGARITDTIRPMNASYGARYSWHKYGQAVDFVPAGGVNSINRDQIRALMGQSGIRLIELLGPGDHGHSNHWHVAFARPGQVIDRTRPIEEDEDWIVNVAQADVPSSTMPLDPEAPPAPASALVSAVKAPPGWDVFASEERRAAHGGGS